MRSRSPLMAPFQIPWEAMPALPSQHPPSAASAEGRRPRNGDVVDCVIERMDARGRGIAALEGVDQAGEGWRATVAVRAGTPGATVRVRLLRGKGRRRFEGALLEVLDEGPDAVPARCPHAGVCGGCAQPRLAYERQLVEKQRLVVEALEAAFDGALPAGVEVAAVEAAPRLSGYRNKMDFTFGARRYVLPDEPEGVDASFGLGLHAPGLFQKVLDVERCDIAFEGASELVRSARELAMEMGLAPWDLRDHTGLLRHLVVRRGERTGELMVDLVTSERAQELIEPYVERLLQRHPEITTFVQNVTSAKATVAYGEAEYVLHGPGRIHDELGGVRFTISADSFFQTNTGQAERLFELAAEAAGLREGDTLLDLYCGAGTAGLVMGTGSREIVGLEQAPSAVRDARHNAERAGARHARYLEGDALETLPALLEGADALDPARTVCVVDPPRAGLHPKVPGPLAAFGARAIVYVSCNPASGARDVAALVEGGYVLRAVRPIDLFPHTPHVEVVFTLERAEASS